MKISNIEQQKNSNDRYNMFIDGEFLVGLSSEAIADNLLYIGKEITQKDIDNYRNDETYYKCLNKSFDYLSRRLHSEKELKDKLNKKFDNRVISQALDRLKTLNYVDDLNFAKIWVKTRQKDRGKAVLKQELFKKGINKEIIEAVLNDDYLSVEDELVAAVNLISKSKFQDMTKDELFNKAGGFLARRGYNYEIIKKALNQVK